MGPARDDETEGGRWGTPAEAARVLGLSADAVRKQIRLGKCRFRARRGNRATWEVLIPDALATVAPERRATDADPRDELVAELRARVAGLEAVVEAQRAHVAGLHTERLKLLAVVERALEQNQREQAERPRRRWRWWRVWEGTG